MLKEQGEKIEEQASALVAMVRDPWAWRARILGIAQPRYPVPQRDPNGSLRWVDGGDPVAFPTAWPDVYHDRDVITNPNTPLDERLYGVVTAAVDLVPQLKLLTLPKWGLDFLWNAAHSPTGQARGGYISGPGGPTDDQIPALLSNGEYVIRAAAVKKLGLSRLDALNNIQHFSEGGSPDVGALGLSTLDTIFGALLAPKGSAPKASASWGSSQPSDPRALLRPAPTSDEHNIPALSAGIQGAASTIGSLLATAASVGIGMTGGGALGGAAAASAIQAGAQLVGQYADGAVNILSSFLVGTVTPAQTGQGYGAPLLAAPPQPAVNNFQSIHNGNVVTNNLDEYNRLKDRKDAQRSLPFLNRVNS